MREIKFRVWYTAQNRMVTDCRLGEMDEEYEDYAIFMQYTGLKDKNGVEIYEGDIVKSKQRGVMESMTVCWNEEDAKFSFVDGGDDWYYVTEGCEVIGNKYENPELL